MVEVGLVRREVLGLRAVAQAVADADGQLVERREDVELRQRERGDPVHPHRIAERDQVEPAAAALAARDGAVLAAELAQARLLPGPAISDGNGPSPTRVTYALETPSTRSIRVGPMPTPVAAPDAIGFDEVTNGYVP